MDEHALIASLCERVRQLEETIDKLATADAILRRAELPPAAAIRAPAHAKPKNRHGLRGIPGGMGALAPVAFFCHDGTARPLLAAAGRWLWRTERDHARMAAAALALGLAGALAVPTLAGPVPRAVVCARRCAVEAQQDADSLTWHPMGRHRG